MADLKISFPKNTPNGGPGRVIMLVIILLPQLIEAIAKLIQVIADVVR